MGRLSLLGARDIRAGYARLGLTEVSDLSLNVSLLRDPESPPHRAEPQRPKMRFRSCVGDVTESYPWLTKVTDP